MNRNTLISIVGVGAMALLSLTGIFGLGLAGITVPLGILLFFITKGVDKQPDVGSGFDIKTVKGNLKDRGIWLWIAMPSISNVICVALAALFLPTFLDHVRARTELVLSFDVIAILVVQLAIFSIGEEIAWRAFLQRQLHKFLSIIPSILITSTLFGLAHVATGRLGLVAYDILFIIINSVFYGIVFSKTNNAWVSGISHFLANASAAAIMLVL